MSHTLLRFVPRMTRLGWNNGTLNAHIQLIYNCLPAPLGEKWMQQFGDPEGYVEQWIVTLLSKPYAKGKRHAHHFPLLWELHEYTQQALEAGLERDWTTFDSVLGIWELSEAKD